MSDCTCGARVGERHIKDCPRRRVELVRQPRSTLAPTHPSHQAPKIAPVYPIERLYHEREFPWGCHDVTCVWCGAEPEGDD